MRWRRAIGGLAAAIVAISLLVYGVGWNEVVANVRAAHPAALAAAVVAGLGMLALRAALVRRLLEPVAGGARGTAFVTAYLSGYFARSALPWGRSTGTPVMAYLLASGSDSDFEDNLAVVAAGEGFNVLGSLVVAGLGVAGFVVAGGSLDAVSAAVAVVGGGGLVAAGVLVVANRGLARRISLEFATRCETVVRKVPYSRLSRQRGFLIDRIDGFFRTLEAIQASRRTLAVAFGIAVVSWVFNALPLYFALLALGVDAPLALVLICAPLALVLICAPLASFGGVVPLPGGSGGIEVVLASLLVATAGVSAGVATAAAILYRLTTYWTHLAIGGCVAVAVSALGTRRFRR
ncbi:lysylphosphatidylglycerol synthase transmembrane domain-containing protein [Natronobacterium texcoconense]|uniref:Lysylphosphatidylglycerol synthase TM region n=1 Tax=Natronobacterium texcoconense TaxID=1095778 RepID=A0A1H1AFV2_NATTX|nr:lysylphosphatidylglycerol synthase transmembrane domain-containing protein [Natronobacterium texcoconense]SDQ38411.1 hypothetical protein SAMN04489842_0677 [Natronobacterium texcoconense]